MSEKMRLNNPHDYAVGIVTPEKEYGVNILQNGVLQLAGEKQKELAATMGVEMENNANFMSDEDIKKKLSGNANQLKKWLSSDDIQPYVLDKIATIAKGMNLSANKLQVLREKMPEYDFLG